MRACPHLGVTEGDRATGAAYGDSGRPARPCCPLLMSCVLV